MVRWSPRMLFQVTVEEACPAPGPGGYGFMFIEGGPM
jgi:hypothetical protein